MCFDKANTIKALKIFFLKGVKQIKLRTKAKTFFIITNMYFTSSVVTKSAHAPVNDLPKIRAKNFFFFTFPAVYLCM